MARASTYTLLALDRYSRIMGIPPPGFNQGLSNTVFPVPNECSDVWFQYSWQNFDSVSREDLALAIANAEEELARIVGFYAAPMWIAQEYHKYPQHHRPDAFGISGLDVRGMRKSILADYGKVISPGQRAVSAVSTGVAVVYSDDDGDGFSETATVSVATTLTDEREVKVYFLGQLGDQEWEIRPARSKSISAGTFVATFWSWQLIDPDNWEAFPTPDNQTPTVDLDVVGNYVTTVDVYREYTDTTANSATFMWEPSPPRVICALCAGVGCAACALTEQNGCLHVRDANFGSVVPTPATYSSGEWSASSFTRCRDPDAVSIYYYAGDLDNRWLRGANVIDPLSNWWAETIAWLATARLERPFCNCGNSKALGDWLQIDMAYTGEDTSFQVSFEDLGNPLGTRIGEIKAWRRVSQLAKQSNFGATSI